MRAAEIPSEGAGAVLRERLMERVRRSAQASRVMHTRRHRDAPLEQPTPGVTLRTLYEATTLERRAGEPQRSCLIELAPGSLWARPGLDASLQREWLVMRGLVQLGAVELGPQDFQLQPAGTPCPTLSSPGGALLLLREAAVAARADDLEHTLRAADAPWADFGPRIQRRVLWQREGQAAMLYRTEAGAEVPCHRHGHDEECLMLRGDLFLDEVLLRPLDYQLAPAGSAHQTVSTDTGVLLYAHGDLDLQMLPR